jgi:hypothetical protein
MPQDWLDALRLARKNLENTPKAPAWLAPALVAALAVAPALAPHGPQDETVPEFFYPH